MEKHENLIIQPKRFTEAYYDFTPTQRDIVASLMFGWQKCIKTKSWGVIIKKCELCT